MTYWKSRGSRKWHTARPEPGTLYSFCGVRLGREKDLREDGKALDAYPSWVQGPVCRKCVFVMRQRGVKGNRCQNPI